MVSLQSTSVILTTFRANFIVQGDLVLHRYSNLSEFSRLFADSRGLLLSGMCPSLPSLLHTILTSSARYSSGNPRRRSRQPNNPPLSSQIHNHRRLRHRHRRPDSLGIHCTSFRHMVPHRLCNLVSGLVATDCRRSSSDYIRPDSAGVAWHGFGVDVCHVSIWELAVPGCCQYRYWGNIIGKWVVGGI